MAAIVIHKWVPTHGIHFIPRVWPQNPAPGAADWLPRARPVRSYTGIWLRALSSMQANITFCHIHKLLIASFSESRSLDVACDVIFTSSFSDCVIQCTANIILHQQIISEVCLTFCVFILCQEYQVKDNDFRIKKHLILQFLC